MKNKYFKLVFLRIYFYRWMDQDEIAKLFYIFIKTKDYFIKKRSYKSRNCVIKIIIHL